MKKLRKDFSERIGKEFGYNEVNLEYGTNKIKYVWIPIGTFIKRYLNNPKYKYTKILAADNLDGIRLYIFKNNYDYVLSNNNSYFAGDLLEIISNKLNAYCVADNLDDILKVVNYFEEIYYSNGEEILTDLTHFIKDKATDFKLHIEEGIEKMYKDIIKCIMEEE